MEDVTQGGSGPLRLSRGDTVASGGHRTGANEARQPRLTLRPAGLVVPVGPEVCGEAPECRPVASFLAHNDQRDAMGRAGRTRAQRDFAEQAMIDGFAAAADAAGDRASWAAR